MFNNEAEDGQVSGSILEGRGVGLRANMPFLKYNTFVYGVHKLAIEMSLLPDILVNILYHFLHYCTTRQLAHFSTSFRLQSHGFAME